MTTTNEFVPDRFRVLFDRSSDAHFILVGDGITDCNDATVKLLKYKNRAEILALHPAVLSPRYQPDGSLSAEKSLRMDAIARERGWHRFEWVHRKSDGEEFPVEVVLNAVTIDGKPAMVAVWHDLTELKRREADLGRLSRELSEKNTALASVNDRMRLDLETAAEAQAALLPQGPIDVPGLGIEWLYRPCGELGGDILNVCRLNDHLVGLYVLDVTGHGAASALLSVTASHFLSSLNDGHHEDVGLACPVTMARRLNRYFSRANLSSKFFTLLYGVLDLRTRTLRYVSAGHPPPVVVPAGGEPKALESSGLPIGLVEDAEYVPHEFVLSPGDRVFFFSDGLYEDRRLDGEEYGLDRLRRFFGDMKHFPIKEAVRRSALEIEQWTHPGALRDDVSLIALEVSPAA